MNPFTVLQPTLDHFRYLPGRPSFPPGRSTRWGHVGPVNGYSGRRHSGGLCPGRACARGEHHSGGIFVTSIWCHRPCYLSPWLMWCALWAARAPRALILTYPTFLIPFCTWLLMGYFKAIPRELEECAMIDGPRASRP